jgi:signal transduction histidine kinase/NAD-dependent dihydropyrimidine dehydrogenase PreA subunit
MKPADNMPHTIQTVPERCRMCYTCVRECPAKAIRIIEGQARVLHERCIGCGNCVRVCSQNAKQVVDTTPRVTKLLGREQPVAALVAPSFPAEFVDIPSDVLVGGLRRLGFRWVHEVSFGADLVAREYRGLLAGNGERHIATTCPAVVLYVEKYFPLLVDRLAPIVSPMVAMARYVRRLHGEDVRTVFIGPCTAKKCEGVDEDLKGEIDAVLTFAELRIMLESGCGNADAPSEFDEPHGRIGAVFPISGGMLQAANIREDLVAREVVSAEGEHFSVAVREFASGDLDTRLLEVLACDGCIMGAGMVTPAPLFRRLRLVSDYARERVTDYDEVAHEAYIRRFPDLDLGRAYRQLDQRIETPDEATLNSILERMGKRAAEDELNCGACGYDTCREHAVAIHKGLAESEMCLPYTIDRLNETVTELAASNQALASTQEALMQSERLASMGQLAAGIAHEVNNPLGVVLMYAHLLLDELRDNDRLRDDAAMIAEQADRCKKIVAGLLHFARQNKVLRQPTDLHVLIDRSCRAIITDPSIQLTVEHALQDPIAEVDGDQLAQVLTNLLSNAAAAMSGGGTVTIATRDSEERVSIAVSDTGTGIPEENLKKIFEPFFTTKQIGKGTGLGLAVTYGIIKMHKGNISVESNADPEKGATGTTFTVELPRKEEVQP